MDKLTPDQVVDLLEYLDESDKLEADQARRRMENQIAENHKKKQKQAAARAARNQSTARNYRLPRKPSGNDIG